MNKLRHLHIKGFRGARFDLPLDFGNGCQSVAIYGENATGKSTITDALEWFLFNRVEHLWREDCREEALRNVLLEKTEVSTVAVQFANQKLDGKKTLDQNLKSKNTNNSTDIRNFLEDAESERIFLRHSQITKIIDKTKTEKKQEIAKIIGYEAILDFREVVRSTTTSLTRDGAYSGAKQNSEAAKTALFKQLGTIVTSEQLLFQKANELAKKFAPKTEIKDEDSYSKCLDELLAKLVGKDRAEKSLLLKQVSKQTISLATQVEELLKKKNLFVEKYSSLVKNKETIEQIKIEKFLSQGKTILDSGQFESEKCPFCLTPYEISKLQIEVEDRIKKIAVLRQEYDDTKTLMHQFANCAATINTACLQFASQYKELQESQKTINAIQPAMLVIKSWTTNTAAGFDKFEPVEFTEPTISTLEHLANIAKAESKNLDGIIAGLDLTDEETKLVESIDKLKDIRSEYKRYEQSSKIEKAFLEQISSLSTISDNFINTQNAALQSVLDAISEDVGKFYSVLHPGESTDKVHLTVVGEEGVEFAYDFHGHATHPPMKYLSESHLNSLGICLFLASAKLFNKQCKFIVLDDIVTSFDANHRRRLLRLLEDEFNDWQIILLTHESLWFDMIRRELGKKGWIFKQTVWDEENGFQLSASAENLKSIIDEKRKKYDVSNDIRKLLEATLKEICHSLQVKVAFRFNDVNEHRMSGELLSELKSTINKKCPLLKNHTIFSHLEGSNLIITVGSHDNPGKAITGGDIDVALKDIEILTSLFCCKECKKLVQANNEVPGQNKIFCKCGKESIDWK